jgi:hypothetical protein
VKERIEAIAIYLLPIVYGLISSAMLGVIVFAFFKAPYQKNVIAAGSIVFLILRTCPCYLAFPGRTTRRRGADEYLPDAPLGIGERHCPSGCRNRGARLRIPQRENVGSTLRI